jgi:uncharacterized protein (TIGR03086 family)
MREKEIFIEANQMFESYFALVKDGQWDTIVPSASDWTVRKLVDHVIENNLATAAILNGETPSESENTDQDSDVAWSESAQVAESAASSVKNGSDTVEGPLGPISKQSFLRLMTIDRTVHSWDLAKAIGADTILNREVATAAYEWAPHFAPRLFDAGEFGEPLAVAGDATAQERLLAMTGREPS